MKPLNSKEIKEIHSSLKEQFGISIKLDYLFYRNREDKIFLMSKDIQKLDLSKFRVNSFGLYFGKIEKSGIRLSIPGTQLIGKKAEKNVLEINNKEEWLNGDNLDCDKNLKGWFIMKNNEDFLGCGYCKEGKLTNYIPKKN
jgi:NOL1/NOP2/fmu family ribosome biogenesis protein